MTKSPRTNSKQVYLFRLWLTVVNCVLDLLKCEVMIVSVKIVKDDIEKWDRGVLAIVA
jgi:hypothetical protein